MIEQFVSSGVTALLTQGTGWVVAVLIGAYAWILDKRVVQSLKAGEQATEKANKAVQEQYEKRLNEFREILDVMSSSTATVKAMHGSLGTTTEAINQLTQAFAKLLSEFNSYQGRWDDRGAIMQKQIEDIRDRLERLQREVTPR